MRQGGGTLRVQSLGFLTQPRIRRILMLAGWRIALGWPRQGDAVGIWGAKPVSRRGTWVACRSGAPLVTIEDGFLRSMAPGVTGAPPLSLIIDDVGFYADARQPSRLERMLQESALTPAKVARARDGITYLRRERLSKYTPPVPRRQVASGHVLVVDQTAGDASIAGSGASPQTFRRMLEAARVENLGARILIKAHPDVIAGRKHGHLGPNDASSPDDFVAADVNPWDLIEGALAVYTVSSQMGYEAVLAGVPARCFGTAFYAGWGLTEDEHPCPRRTRHLTTEELFHGCHLAYPLYYDPWRDQLCDFETTASAISHEVSAQTAPCSIEGDVFVGARRWKRRALTGFRPHLPRQPVFVDDVADAKHRAKTEKRAVWLWASRADRSDHDALNAADVPVGFVEDGFLRSVGLGADLTVAGSLVFDSEGIYFDPTAPSDLEGLITQAAEGRGDEARASALIASIAATGVTKYNVGAKADVSTPEGRRVILVPGQVENDASIERGCGELRTNLGLLEAARAANPDAWLVFKPHPDVEAKLRPGHVPEAQVTRLADQILPDASAAAALAQCDAIWTLTSLMGFEGLLRGKAVTCLGMPFYAGWGLTTDLGPRCERRTARPTLAQLVWAALIAYPSYRDPVSGLPCPPELIVERLASGVPSPKATMLSRLQGAFAGHTWLWRR